MDGALGSDTAQEEFKLQRSAEELQSAIVTALHSNQDPLQLRLANEWITTFLSFPLAWSVSLYLAFPPSGSRLGLQQEVRFFSLNLLLSKIRTDWLQLAAADAREIYDVLIRQLSLNGHDKIVRARLCVVVSSAAALAGAETCYELVENAVGDTELELDLRTELLTALAEETLHRSRALSWVIRDCMQECCPQVLIFLQKVVTTCGQTDLLGKFFTCLERWIQAGVTLSELYSEYPSLFHSLVEALGSSNNASFEAAVWALSELVSQVDILPNREDAVRALVKATLAQKWQYDAAATVRDMVEQTKELSTRAHGLCLLISELGSVEGALLARARTDGASILEWLVDASRGGGGLGLEGASMAVEVWPRLVAIPHTRRGELLQASIFGAAAQAIMQAAKYPLSFENWDDFELEEEYFYRFRTNVAEEALIAIFKELKEAFLSLILEMLNCASTWQDAEVCLYAATSLSKEVIVSITNPQYTEEGMKEKESVGTSFLKRILVWLLGSSAEMEGQISRRHGRFLEASVVLLERYAERVASDGSLIEQTIQYTINAFHVSEARVRAAYALKELCRAAAPRLAAACSMDVLIGTCEAALSVPVQIPEEQQRSVQTAVVEGLASVAAVLPATKAEAALTSLTIGAVSTIKDLSMGQGKADQMGNALASSLKVVTAAVEYGSVQDGRSHPALRLLQDIWPVLESLIVTWAADAVVAAAVCELWGMVASKVGVAFVGVLPGIINSASSMFKLHQVAAPLVCLSNVVRLVPLRPTPELENCLAVVLHEVTSVHGTLDKMLDSVEYPRHSASSMRALSKDPGGWHDSAVESLCAIYELGRHFLQFCPAIILSSAAFLQIFHSATASVSRKDPDVALVAAKFLSEAILGAAYGNGEKKDQLLWKLPSELLPHVDQAVGYYGVLAVELVLKRLAARDVVEPLMEALADVLYGLCLRYAAATEAALVSTLNAADFPGRRGLLTELDKNHFVAAVIRQPPHPRRRFQELIGVFSRVCQSLMPAEALQHY